MKVNKDVFSLKFLREGTPVYEFLKNSSANYLEILASKDLIYFEEGRIFLTERGQVARELGVEKYFELEEFEQELSSYDAEKGKTRNAIFFSVMLILILILVFALGQTLYNL